MVGSRRPDIGEWSNLDGDVNPSRVVCEVVYDGIPEVVLAEDQSYLDINNVALAQESNGSQEAPVPEIKEQTPVGGHKDLGELATGEQTAVVEENDDVETPNHEDDEYFGSSKAGIDPLIEESAARTAEKARQARLIYEQQEKAEQEREKLKDDVIESRAESLAKIAEDVKNATHDRLVRSHVFNERDYELGFGIFIGESVATQSLAEFDKKYVHLDELMKLRVLDDENIGCVADKVATGNIEAGLNSVRITTYDEEMDYLGNVSLRPGLEFLMNLEAVLLSDEEQNVKVTKTIEKILDVAKAYAAQKQGSYRDGLSKIIRPKHEPNILERLSDDDAWEVIQSVYQTLSDNEAEESHARFFQNYDREKRGIDKIHDFENMAKNADWRVGVDYKIEKDGADCSGAIMIPVGDRDATVKDIIDDMILRAGGIESESVVNIGSFGDDAFMLLVNAPKENPSKAPEDQGAYLAAFYNTLIPTSSVIPKEKFDDNVELGELVSRPAKTKNSAPMAACIQYTASVVQITDYAANFINKAISRERSVNGGRVSPYLETRPALRREYWGRIEQRFYTNERLKKSNEARRGVLAMFEAYDLAVQQGASPEELENDFPQMLALGQDSE